MKAEGKDFRCILFQFHQAGATSCDYDTGGSRGVSKAPYECTIIGDKSGCVDIGGDDGCKNGNIGDNLGVGESPATKNYWPKAWFVVRGDGKLQKYGWGDSAATIGNHVKEALIAVPPAGNGGSPTTAPTRSPTPPTGAPTRAPTAVPTDQAQSPTPAPTTAGGPSAPTAAPTAASGGSIVGGSSANGAGEEDEGLSGAAIATLAVGATVLVLVAAASVVYVVTFRPTAGLAAQDAAAEEATKAYPRPDAGHALSSKPVSSVGMQDKSTRALVPSIPESGGRKGISSAWSIPDK